MIPHICQEYQIFSNDMRYLPITRKFDQIPPRPSLQKAALLAGSPPSEKIEYFDSEFPPLEPSDGVLKILIRNSYASECCKIYVQK